MRLLTFVLLFAALFSGCKKKFECPYDPCYTVAPAAEIKAVQDYLTANNLTATQHCSGLFYKIENVGTGDYPDGCSTVSANYVGRFTNGTIFDQAPNSRNPGPLQFDLQGVIRGWTNGLPLIKEGGRIILYVPPSLGYGSTDRRDQNGNVVIPGNAILIFDVTLVDVR